MSEWKRPDLSTRPMALTTNMPTPPTSDMKYSDLGAACGVERITHVRRTTR